MININIFDVILKRHRGSNRKNVCVFYDENKMLAVEKMGEYVKKNGFTIYENNGRFTIADVIQSFTIYTIPIEIFRGCDRY